MSFVCILDNFLLKNVFFFPILVIKFQNGVHLGKKKVIIDLNLTFFNHQGKDIKIPSALTSLAWIHVFSLLFWPFFICLTNLAICWFSFASFRLFVCLLICLFVCLSVNLFVCFFVCFFCFVLFCLFVCLFSVDTNSNQRETLHSDPFVWPSF